MIFQQLVQPNLTIIGKNGYCLAYVEDVFGTPHTYPNATAGWHNAQFKHPDEPSSNISVPIWFSFDDPDGHVAVWSNGTIHSTTANGMKTFANIQALLNFMNNGTINEHMVYLGWSEDLENVRIVKGAPPVSNAIDILRIIASEVEGFDSTKTHAGEYDKQLTDAWGSKPIEDYIRHAFQVNPNKRGDLIREIDSLQKQLAAEGTKLAPGKYIVG